MAEATYNYIGENVEVTGKILRHAIEAVKGSSVRVAPFKDEYLTRLGVWLQGEQVEVVEAVVKLNKELKDKKVEFHFMPWMPAAQRG